MGMLVMVLVFGFVFIACSTDSDDDDDTDNNSTGTSINGTWEASNGRVIVFTGNTFEYKVNGATQYSGTFSTSGSTITFNESNLGKASGNFELSESTLVLSNHTWDSSINGAYGKPTELSGTWQGTGESLVFAGFTFEYRAGDALYSGNFSISSTTDSIFFNASGSGIASRMYSGSFELSSINSEETLVLSSLQWDFAQVNGTYKKSN
jgi:hypothetical protein